MKLIVFNILFANLLTLGTLQTNAGTRPENEGDTVVVRLKNKNKVLIVTDKDKDLGSFRSVDLNKLVADIDSTLRIDSLSQVTGQAVLKDSTLRIRKYSGNLGPRKSYQITVDTWESTESDTSHSSKWRSYKNKQRIDDLFEVDLGWNNYFEKGTIPADANKRYGLLPIWSNLVALRFQKKLYWCKNSTRWANTVGLELAWNNYKYDNAVIITKGASSVSWEPFEAGQSMRKSKLTVTWLNLPVMIHYHAKRSSFHAAIGGFAGYRLESHSKTKFDQGGETHKRHVDTNFFLNSLQYGARVQIGLFDVDFFAQYNFNELFNSGKGPALTPFAFGFTL